MMHSTVTFSDTGSSIGLLTEMGQSIANVVGNDIVVAIAYNATGGTGLFEGVTGVAPFTA